MATSIQNSSYHSDPSTHHPSNSTQPQTHTTTTTTTTTSSSSIPSTSSSSSSSPYPSSTLKYHHSSNHPSHAQYRSPSSSNIHQSLPTFLHHDLSSHPSNLRSRLRFALIALSILAAMSIVTDWWAHAQFNTFRYPWSYQTSHLTNSKTTNWNSLSKHYRGLPACDPFKEPGSVIFNQSFYHDASWVPFGSSCPPSPDYLSALRSIHSVPINATLQDRNRLIQHPSHPPQPSLDGQAGDGREMVDIWGRPYPNLDFLRGKTILWLGDSVDRNGLQHLHELLDANVRGFSYTNIHGPVPQGWDPRSTPWEVDLGLLDPRNRNATGLKNPAAQFAGLNCRLVNGFFYGLDDINEFAVQADWHPPGLAEQRIEELFRPMADQFAAEDHEAPAFISIQSGLWDLAFFGRRNREANMTTEAPLTAVQLDWWQNRMKSVIKTLKHTWPNTPIWIRKTHRVGDQYWASHDWNAGLKHGMGEGFVNFFSDVRVHQLQEMQEQVARDEGVPIFDWGKLWEGYQKYQDKVHPLKIPGGVLMNQALMHHIWMESVGRENWDPSLTAGLGPLPHPRH